MVLKVFSTGDANYHEFGTDHPVDAKLMRTTINNFKASCTTLNSTSKNKYLHFLKSFISFIFLGVMSPEYKDHEGEQEE